MGIEALVEGAAQVTSTSTAVTTTVTTSVTSTQIISVIQASSPAEGQAAYSFAEDNGTTTWFGATPPASASLVTSTQVVTLQPVPTGVVAPPVEIPSITSYLTLSSTQTITETLTETQTLAISTATASAGVVGAFTGLAYHGWNSSMSTFVKVKLPPIGSVTIAEQLPYRAGTAYPMAPSGIVPLSPSNAMINARDVGEIVATIDGVVVSWTNNYDGTSLSTSFTSPINVPVTATALQSSRKFPRLCPGHQLTGLQATSSTFSGLVQTEQNSPKGPTTTVGVYPWNMFPTPSSISTSSESATQLTKSHGFSSHLYSNTTTALSTAATTSAPSCGDASAEFMIDFDDLPAFSAGPEVRTFLEPMSSCFDSSRAAKHVKEAVDTRTS